MRFEQGRPVLDVHRVHAGCPLVRPALLERSPQVATLAELCHEVCTKHWAFGWLSRWERINPRSGAPWLHPSCPGQGQLDGVAVFPRALKRQRLRATPHRSGLQGPWDTD